MPATKEPARLPKDVQKCVTFVAENRSTLLSAAEQIIFAYAPEIETHGPAGTRALHIRRNFNADEQAVFDSLGWDDDRLTREIARVRNVLELQKRAGTTADRELAASNLAAAEKAIATRGPQIEAEIQKLQSELAALQESVKGFGGEVARRTDAVEKLRDKLPQHVRDEVQRRKNDIKQEFADEIHGLEQDIQTIQEQLRKVQLTVPAELRPAFIQGLVASPHGNPAELEGQLRDAREELARVQAVRKQRTAEAVRELVSMYDR
jgi:uncharacterized protein YoxC